MKPLRRLIYVLAFLFGGVVFATAIILMPAFYIATGKIDAPFDFLTWYEKTIDKIKP